MICSVVCSDFPLTIIFLLQLGNCTDQSAHIKNKTPALERAQEMVSVENEDCSPHLQAHFHEMEEIISKHAPATLRGPVFDLLNATHSWKSSFNLASNSLSVGTSALANHVDAKSVLPAAMTCCNPMCSNRPWFHGELLCTQGAFLIHHTLGNAVTMFGDSCHAVPPIAPRQGASNPARFSMIHFSHWGTHLLKKKKGKTARARRCWKAQESAMHQSSSLAAVAAAKRSKQTNGTSPLERGLAAMNKDASRVAQSSLLDCS